MSKSEFKTVFGETIFRFKYAQNPDDSWAKLAKRIVEDVCGSRWGTLPVLMCKDDRDQLAEYIRTFKFVPGGRYLYYAGRPFHAFNNCYLLRAEEDTREEWGQVAHKAMSCLTTGGGIGADYSILREKGAELKRTGGTASGPIPLMEAVNEIGRRVMQGGSRRSAIYASLNHAHPDVADFLTAKDWHNIKVGTTGLTVADLKAQDFNYHAPLDMTNISVNYDENAFVDGSLANNPIFLKNCEQALRTGEPGFSFNFYEKINETLRNACTEVTSEDDSDVCNLGSVHMGNIANLEEHRSVVHLAAKFLVCGTLRADLPYEKVYKVREKNRRLGLGLMGIHEWLLQRGKEYEVDAELHKWLQVYEEESEKSANEHCDRFFLNRPVAYRAIAPTGSIGILAG